MPEKVHIKFTESRHTPDASHKGFSPVNAESNGKKRTAQDAFRDTKNSKVPNGEPPKAPFKPTSQLRQRATELQRSRKQLPIYAHREEICERLQDDHSVLLLVGETGSGKSTQVPQFLFDEQWFKALS